MGCGIWGKWVIYSRKPDRELEGPRVAYSHRVGPAGGLGGAEGAAVAVLAVHRDAARSVPRTLPDFDLGIERPAIGAQVELGGLRAVVGVGAQRAALDDLGGSRLPAPLGGHLLGGRLRGGHLLGAAHALGPHLAAATGGTSSYAVMW